MRKLLLLSSLFVCAAWAQNPVVRLSYVTLFSGVNAHQTGPLTSVPARIPNGSGYGTLTFDGSGITGSPSGCNIFLNFVQSSGPQDYSSTFLTQSFTPSNSYQSWAVVPLVASLASGDMLVATYSCTVYPTAGTFTLAFNPTVPTSIVSSTILGTTANVTQFGGGFIATGTGASGAGIPRVTVSNDSSLAAHQSVNVDQLNGTTIDTNSGVKSNGTQRVVIATDQPSLTNSLNVSTVSNYVQLFSGTSMTATRTSSPVRIPNGSGYGTLAIDMTGITGSPSGCGISLYYVQPTGPQDQISAAPTVNFSVSNTAVFAAVTPATGYETGDMMQAVFFCTTFPTAGSMTVTFNPYTPVGVVGTASVSANVTKLGNNNIDTFSGTATGGTQRVVLATDQPTLTNALKNNVTQLNGTTVDTNAGTKSAGTLRVTLATDQTTLTNTIGSVQVLGNTGGAFDQAPGSATPARAVQVGGTDGTNTIVPYIDPCQRGSKTYTPINIATTTTTTLVAGTASKNTYVCEINLVTAAANNIGILSGTGTNCGTTVHAGLFGGTTNATGWNFAANGGITLGNGIAAVASTSNAADNICISLSAASQTSGNIVTVQY